MKEFEISRLIADTWHSAFMAGYKHGYKDCMKNHEKSKNMFMCEMNPCGMDVCPYVLGAGNVLSCEECELNDELQKCENCNHYKLTCDLFSEICKYEPKTESQTVDMFALDMAVAKCKAQHDNCKNCDKKCMFRNGINNE
jgi:hypothetical protein